MVTYLSFSLGPKQRLSKLSKPDERPLNPVFHLVIVKNNNRIIIPNDNLNLEHPTVVAQLKPLLKE